MHILQPTMVFLRCTDEDQHRARRAATYHYKMSISHNEHELGGLRIICCRSLSSHTSLGLHKLLLVDQTLDLINCLSRNYLCPSRCCSSGFNLTLPRCPPTNHKCPITSTLGFLSHYLPIHERQSPRCSICT